MVATKRVNITVDPNVERFIKITEYKGIKVSTWINMQMKRFLKSKREAN